MEVAAVLGDRAQGRRVGQHLGQRHRRLDGRRAGIGIHALDPATARVEVAHDVAEVVLGNVDFDLHDRLEQGRLAFGGGIPEGLAASKLERHFRRIDRVLFAIEKGDLEVHHRIAGDDAALGGFPDALVHRRPVGLGNRTAEDLVDELVALAVVGLHFDRALGELARAAGLLLVACRDLRARLDGLAIGDLGLVENDIDVVALFEPADDDLDV